jgi:drug/metabolite transporter (DMT)-like permease
VAGAAARTSRLGVPAEVGLWMLASAVGFAVLVCVVRRLSAELDVLVVQVWRNVFAVLLFAPWLARVGLAGLRTRRLPLFLTRSALFVVSSTALFYGVTMVPVADATALSFTAPLFTTILAVLLLKERVDAARWGAIAAGFAGMLVILRPGVGVFDAGAAVVVLTAAASFALVTVTGKLLASSESPALVTACLSVFALPLSIVPALFVWSWPAPEHLGWLLLIGLAANLNMYGFARAMRIGDASMATPSDFIRLPATALVAFLMFGQAPEIWTWVGAAIIVAASVYVGRRK